MVRLSVFNGVSDNKGEVVSMDAVIKRIFDGGRNLDQKTRNLNEWYHENPAKYDERKKDLPAVTWSGHFSARNRKSLIQHSGHVVLDVDDTLNIDSVMADFKQNPHVRFAFISPSGTGGKPVIPVYPVPKTPEEHEYAFNAVLDVFDAYVRRDPKMMKAQKEVCRLCFLAHDAQPIDNPNAIPIRWEYPKEPIPTTQQRTESNPIQFVGEADLEALDHVPNDCDYETWRNVGMAIKDAGFGVDVFQKWTGGQRRRSTGDWVDEDIHAHWSRYNASGITWASVVHIAMQNGYTPPQRERKAKLQRSNDAPSEPTETLDENHKHRETATDTFLTTDTDDTLHILLVKDSTGTGKSHTMLSKSQQHGKRTLMNPPHKKLAAQAVEIAREHGYLNPFHLLGREHNWGDSGIADIPVEMRTADLFEKNNCIMVDQIKPYTDKRLAPRTYCEHQCPFRDGCPHLAQYEGLKQFDFVASCTPNLLFDLNMRGYLKSLVTAADEPSDEELAIDAILGTESKETTEFDFAILDDYGISGLYTDITFSESDFKALKKAWNRTPTGDFAKLLLKAFEKKKPQKIIKALRKAFETTTEHRTEIAKNLTLHARTGIIEYAERPKVSKETERLLAEKVVRYTDGGKQFIPVSWESYEELTEKGVPSINPKLLETQEIGEQVRVPHTPTHALIAGVNIEALTPVWQEGATPIEILDIFLKSIGNDRNAPIHRTFRTGDPPVAILTFSIPPQAPVGLIPQIAMLSATTDTADTQRAFDGQPVTFSEHTGGVLEWAPGVQVSQYQDARLTSGSIFEYPKNTDGKRLLQETPTGITPTAEKQLAKLNHWAEGVDGLTAFISFKEFTNTFAEAVNGFDIVAHFDKIAGLNFDGLKFLVVFGYPKVKHEIVIEHARKQYARDRESLPKGSYDELTETAEYKENGITITERRYKDHRLEKIRHQLSTEKLEQAIGRSRLPRWTDTTTLIFTDAPITSITERATLFSAAAFNLAEAPSELSNAMQQIQDAEANGDVKAVAESQGVSERTARRKTQTARQQKNTKRDERILELHHDGHSLRDIHSQMKEAGHKISFGTVSNVVKAYKNRQHQLVYTYRQCPKMYTPTNPVNPCIESETLHTPEVEPDHDTFFKLLDVSACFYGKHQLSASDISQFTGIDESEVREILDDWYQVVVISPGIGEKYWMTERDKKQLWEKILGPTHTEWEQNFPGQKILCPPVAFNPHLNPKNTF